MDSEQLIIKNFELRINKVTIKHLTFTIQHINYAIIRYAQ